MAIINQLLDRQQSPIRLIFVSSYIPRKCGLATFTKDLTGSLNDLNPDNLSEIIAIDNQDPNIYYPWEVKYKIHRDNLDSYYQAAQYVNQSSADVISLQHEFGLYGGTAGENIFSFLRNINKPIVTTLHTVLEDPPIAYRSALQRVAAFSSQVVVMIPEARERLEKQYGIPRDKIVIIHHGVSDQPKANKSKKKKLNWQGKNILLITGLINRNKGIEYGIRAMPQIVKKFQNTVLVIVGQTHPEILKTEGEKYRRELMALARSLKVSENVKFVNKYLSLNSLLNYYEACDIYLTPHIDPHQMSSGTLAYALGMGKACISTPYPYANCMLSNNRGILVSFKNSKEIEKASLSILSNPELASELERNAYALGRKMCWSRVGERYLNLFRYNSIASKKNERNRITTSRSINR